MTQAASFTIVDREVTPGNHTFKPNGFSQDNSVAFFKNAGTTVLEDEKFSISWRESNTVRKVRVKLEVPVVVNETINGVTVPKVARTSIADVTFNFALSSTEAERDNVVGMLADALASDQSVINSTLIDGEAIW
jgi:hypothetical protein